MPATATPLLKEDSVLAWEIESTFKTAPASGTWRSFGRVEEWADFGPQNAIFRDNIAGAGREASSIGYEGVSYRKSLAYQVVDPKSLGFVWGQELNAPTDLGGGNFRHAVTPTTKGLLPSASIQMRDKNPSGTDKTTFLGAVCPKLVLRGEEIGEDGSGGKLMAVQDWMPHKDDDTVADKTGTPLSLEPYRFHHSKISILDDPKQVFRVKSFEMTLDNQAKYAYYWQDSTQRFPFEAPPENIQYDLNMVLVADLDTFLASKQMRELAADQATLDLMSFEFTRNATTDNWLINISKVVFAETEKRRRQGKIEVGVRSHFKASAMQYVDQSSVRFFPQ